MYIYFWKCSSFVIILWIVNIIYKAWLNLDFTSAVFHLSIMTLPVIIATTCLNIIKFYPFQCKSEIVLFSVNCCSFLNCVIYGQGILMKKLIECGEIANCRCRRNWRNKKKSLSDDVWFFPRAFFNSCGWWKPGKDKNISDQPTWPTLFAVKQLDPTGLEAKNRKEHLSCTWNYLLVNRWSIWFVKQLHPLLGETTRPTKNRKEHFSCHGRRLWNYLLVNRWSTWFSFWCSNCSPLYSLGCQMNHPRWSKT